MDIELTADQRATIREILLSGWPSLSRGDRSAIGLALEDSDSCSTAIPGTPMAEFWEQLVALGWAERSIMDMSDSLNMKVHLFAFTAQGREDFQEFQLRFELERVTPIEELSYCRSALYAGVVEAWSDVGLLDWKQLCDEVGSEKIISQKETDGKYYGITQSIEWADQPEQGVEVTIRGYLHKSHHKVVSERSRMISKPTRLRRLLRKFIN